MRKIATSIIGGVLGIVIIIIGFCVQGISIDVYGRSIGRDIAFGADFYTEMYDVTRDVGYAVNGAKTAIAEAAEGVCDAIGWLIVAIGVFDFAYFGCKMDKDYFGDNYSAAPTTASTYTTQSQATPTSYSAPSIIEPASTANAGEWECTCGKIHKNYEMSCVCGITKQAAKAAQNKNTTPQPQKDIFASVKGSEATNTVKRCPYCGDIVKSDRCEMCGKEVK